MKKFNTEGICIPSKHYMADVSHKVQRISEMIEEGLYFTVNRPRQYGKTTLLNELCNSISADYYVVDMSFEGVGDSYFSDEKNFCTCIRRDICERLSLAEKYMEIPCSSFYELGKIITEICRESDKPVVLLIDEVDKSSDNQIFLSFLGMLRSKYLESRKGRDFTFCSVILAGVYDIKNLKLRYRADEEKKYNSPWNIAADFEVDMSFSIADIETMLSEFETDCHTGMDTAAVSEIIRDYTGGYPYLVSRLCMTVQKNELEWTPAGIQNAVKILVNESNTLFDDIYKNLKNHPEFADLVESIIIRGEEIPFVFYDDAIQLGTVFGILREDKSENGSFVKVSNKIFELLLYNIFISRNRRSELSCERSQFIEDGKLNMEKVLLKFQELMACEYGILTNKDRYTKFSFMNYTVTFMTSKDLIRYERVKSINNGVLTVSCIGKVKKEYEDYIDLSYILSNLRMNPEVYLKGMKGVEVRNA